MFVNKTVLADCGIEVPGPDYSWDQFLADCQTIKDNGYTPIACSLVEVPHYWFEFLVMNNGTVENQGWLTGTYMYDQTFNRMNVDYGSTIAVLIVVLGVVLSNVANRVFRPSDDL